MYTMCYTVQCRAVHSTVVQHLPPFTTLAKLEECHFLPIMSDIRAILGKKKFKAPPAKQKFQSEEDSGASTA